VALARLWQIFNISLFSPSASKPSQQRQSGSEADVVARARRMDPEAWDVIFNRYYPEIYAYLRYRTRSPEDAEDLAATVFERAVRHIEKYKEMGRGLGAWLQRIASNLVIDYYRRRSVPVRQAEPLSPRLADRQPSPAEQAMRADQVHRALSMLNDAQQEVLVLRFLLGYSVADTAHIMGRSEEAVKALQYRALRYIREAWQEEPPRGHQS